MPSPVKNCRFALALLFLAAVLTFANAQSAYIKMESTGTSTCSYNCYNIPCPATSPCSCFADSITLTAPIPTLSCALYFVGDVEVTSLLIQPSFNNLTIGFVDGQWKSGSLSLVGSSSSMTLRDFAFSNGASLSGAVSALTLSNVSMGNSTMTLATPTVVMANFSTSGQIIVSSSDVVLNMTNAVVSTSGTLIVSDSLRNSFNFKGVSGSALQWIDSTYAPSCLSIVGSDLSLVSSSSSNGTFFSILPADSLSITNSTFRNANSGLSATLFQTTSTMDSIGISNATFLPSATSRISFGPSFPLTGQLSITDSSFGSEFGSISWTSTASLLIKNSNFGQLSNAADTGLVAPFNIYNLSSAVSLCTEDVELGVFSLLYSIDAATDTSSPTAIALFCNSSIDSLRVTSSFSITGAYTLAVSSVVSIGSQYLLTVSNGASLIIPTTFTLTSVYLDLSDPSSTLYYAPGGVGSAFSVSTLNGSMSINSNAAIKLATGLSNLRLILATPSNSSTLPRAGDVFTILKSVSVTYGSAFVTASPWKVQVASNSISGDLTFSFVNQTCSASCIHPNLLGCISTSACSCDEAWGGETCDVSTAPLPPPSPMNDTPVTFPSNTTTTIGPGSNTTYAGDLVVDGDLVISPNASIVVNGTLTVNGKILISANVEEERIGSNRREGLASTQALPFCVISSLVSIRASKLVFSANSLVRISLNVSAVSSDGSCVEPPLTDPIWSSLNPLFYSDSSTNIDSQSAWRVNITGSSEGKEGIGALQFSLPLLNSSDSLSSSGVVSRIYVSSDAKKSCGTISSKPGSANLIVSPCSPPAPRSNKYIYIIVFSIVGAIVFVGLVLLFVMEPWKSDEDYEPTDIPYVSPENSSGAQVGQSVEDEVLREESGDEDEEEGEEEDAENSESSEIDEEAIVYPPIAPQGTQARRVNDYERPPEAPSGRYAVGRTIDSSDSDSDRRV